MTSRNPRLLAFAAGAVFAAAATAATPDAQPAIHGFSAQRVPAQLTLEQRFDAQIKAGDLREWLKHLAAEPNHVGSPHDKANAEFVRDRFRDWGWEARIETFEVLYPTPKRIALEMTAPTAFKAALNEPAVAGDDSSARLTNALPPFVAFGGDGDVEAELVYVNFGMPDDYTELERRGIAVKGKIVIARYGAGWRGLKPKLAQEHGAIGCIIYSDPVDDGYGIGDVYPLGGQRPAAGVQRGSVADMPIYPGDALTPGVGATRDAKRLSLAEARTVLKIPALPISYGDAQPLLAALGGAFAPESFRGGLPIAYHLGPGPAKVHLVVQSNWDRKTIYNVIATLPGKELPDQWVIRGNHRDAWVFGAWDPLSGTAAMLAEAKAIGALVKSGWKPKRTLVYASWDGEEAGLIGSTEWVETHAEELAHKAVLYINSDTNSRGFLNVGGSHSWQHAVNQVAEAVRDPQTGVSVRERLRAQELVAAYAKDPSSADKPLDGADADADLKIDALGSGSDFTPFLQHLGIATLNLAFNGEEQQAGVYHSSYDTFEHYERFGDPGFAYGVALAQTAGRLVLRSVDADVLPMSFTPFADTVAGYVDDLHTSVQTTRQRSEALGRLLDRNAFVVAADPTGTYVAPVREDRVPVLEFAPLDNALAQLRKSAAGYDRAYAQVESLGLALSPATRAKLDELLRGMENTLTDARGLPGRDWYRHLIYAPGLLTGYGVKTLPKAREAIEGRQWTQANGYLVDTAKVLELYSERLDQATRLLQPVTMK